MLLRIQQISLKPQPRYELFNHILLEQAEQKTGIRCYCHAMITNPFHSDQCKHMLHANYLTRTPAKLDVTAPPCNLEGEGKGVGWGGRGSTGKGGGSVGVGGGGDRRDEGTGKGWRRGGGVVGSR